MVASATEIAADVIGQERTQDRAEGEQQDHQRDGDADALRGRRFTTDEGEHAVGPDLQAIAAVLFLDQIQRGDDVVVFRSSKDSPSNITVP